MDKKELKNRITHITLEVLYGDTFVTKWSIYNKGSIKKIEKYVEKILDLMNNE